MCWVRGKVVSKLPDGTFRLFLLDYGHNLDTELSLFTELPNSLKGESDLIKRGSLGLTPCERTRVNGKLITKPIPGWNKAALDLVKALDNPFETRKFFFVQYKFKKDGTYVGDLVVKTTHDTTSISQKLVDEGYAIREEGLVPKVPLSRNQMPIASFEKIFNVLHHGEAGSDQSKPPAVMPAANAASTSINMKENMKPLATPQLNRQVPTTPSPLRMNITPSPQPTKPSASTTNPFAFPPPKIDKNAAAEPSLRPSIPKPLMPKLPSALSNCNPQKAEPPSAKPPTDILAFGESLIAPFPSIQAASFLRPIEEKLKEYPITKIQSHCWSQILFGRSMVVIAKFSNEGIYAPPIINSIRKSQSSSGFGPVAVIIAKTTSEVESITKYCKTLITCLNVVTAAGLMDAKTADVTMEVMNGCDVLVSTPPAFTRMIAGVAKNLIFDKSRIKHLVFHRFDTLIKPFKQEVDAIITTLMSGQEKKENNPQIVITSPRWIEEIRPMMKGLMDSKNMVVCIENFIEAAAFIGCKVTIVTATDADEKNKKLLESLKEGIHKKARTMIVTNDEESSKGLTVFLKASSVAVSSADEKNYQAAKAEWMRQKEGSYSALVVHDAILAKMELRNVHNLIHFSFSSKRFSERHAALLENFYAILEKKAVPKASTTIYLDNDDTEQFSSLVEFLRSRQMVKLPENLLNAAKVSLS